MAELKQDTVERWQVESYLEFSPEAIDHLRIHGASNPLPT